MRRAAARTSDSSTPLRAQYSATGTAASASSVSSTSAAWSASHRWATRSSCTITPARAASSQASVPGRTWRWKSASSAVSVRRGSMTTSDRPGSRAISFSVVRAWGMLWLCQGFLPTNTATSACSKSARTIVPSMWWLTQNSPVFSWARALERNRPPTARNSALP